MNLLLSADARSQIQAAIDGAKAGIAGLEKLLSTLPPVADDPRLDSIIATVQSIVDDVKASKAEVVNG